MIKRIYIDNPHCGVPKYNAIIKDHFFIAWDRKQMRWYVYSEEKRDMIVQMLNDLVNDEPVNTGPAPSGYYPVYDTYNVAYHKRQTLKVDYKCQWNDHLREWHTHDKELADAATEMLSRAGAAMDANKTSANTAERKAHRNRASEYTRRD